ncbi:hypothetical protein M2C03_24615, partial [Klebsiella pneumoniae]|nr:hypothetical protein [Klebsiella pneumoniae]
KMPAFEWVHVQLHQQKGMISLSPPTICNSAPLDITFTRLRAVRREGVNEHGPVQMSGGEREIFFGLMKRSGMAGKNLLRKALPSPGQQDGLCLSQPRRMDSNG